MPILFKLKEGVKGPSCPNCGQEVRLIQKDVFSPTFYSYFCFECGHAFPVTEEEAEAINETIPQRMERQLQIIEEAAEILKKS